MHEFDQTAAINLATEYLDQPNRYRSEHDGAARVVVKKTTAMLAKIAHSVSTNSERNAGAEFTLRFDTDPKTRKPARAAKKSGEPVYGAGISLAFVESLFNRVAPMADMPSRKFDPGAFVAFASVTAMAHEFSHGIYGHFELDTDDERELYFQELEADRRGGCGSLVIANDADVFQMMHDFFGISNIDSLLEVGFFAQSLLACALSGSSEAIYADSGLRNFLYFDGLRSVVFQKGYADFLQLEVARKNADRLAFSVVGLIADGKDIVELRSQHLDYERLWRTSLKEEVSDFSDRMIARSRFR